MRRKQTLFYEKCQFNSVSSDQMNTVAKLHTQKQPPVFFFMNETTAMSLSLYSLLKHTCILLHCYIENGTKRFVAPSRFTAQHSPRTCQVLVLLLLRYKALMVLKLVGVRSMWIHSKTHLTMEWMHYRYPINNTHLHH